MFFKEAIAKMRKAHAIELRWIKSEAMKAAREYVNRKNAEVQGMVTRQILDMFR